MRKIVTPLSPSDYILAQSRRKGSTSEKLTICCLKSFTCRKLHCLSHLTQDNHQFFYNKEKMRYLLPPTLQNEANDARRGFIKINYIA